MIGYAKWQLKFDEHYLENNLKSKQENILGIGIRATKN